MNPDLRPRAPRPPALPGGTQPGAGPGAGRRLPAAIGSRPDPGASTRPPAAGQAPGQTSRRRPDLRLLAIACLTASGLPDPAGAAPQPVTEVHEQGRDGVTFVVELPPLQMSAAEVAGRSFTAVSARGFGLTADPGLPMLPFRSFTIAVPPASEPVPQVEVLESETLDLVPAPSLDPDMQFDDDGQPAPGFREVVDEAFYASSRVYPELRFATSRVSYLRQQRVFDLTVYPVRYDAGRRQLVVARRLRVRVDFRRTGGGLRSGAERLAAPALERGFESIYRGLIVNYQSSRSWRQGRLIPKGGPPRAPRLENRQWKIKVRESGLLKIDFSDLPDFEPGVAVSQLAVYERRFVDAEGESFASDPVPIEVDDANSNGVFDPGDAIRFYGRNHEDRFGPEPYLNRYTYDNTYWLTWESAGGARIGSRDGWLDHASPAVPASFPDTVHVEEDIFDEDYAPRPNVSPPHTARELVNPWYLSRAFPLAIGNLPDCSRVDPYCVLGNPPGRCVCSAFSIPFEVWDIDPGQPIRLRSLLVSAEAGWIHMATYRLIDGNQDTTTVASRWECQPAIALGPCLYESGDLPAAALTEGGNEFWFKGERARPSAPDDIANKAAANLDWFEILYARRYRAHNDYLRFDSGEATGDLEFRVGFFSSPDIVVYDVTDPMGTVRLDEVQIVDEGGGRHEARFQDVVAGRRTYVAFAPGAGELEPLAVIEDEPSSLASPAVEPDIIIVADDEFADLLVPLENHREAQGHRVEIARLSDVYDEFDGGLERAFAIRNYLRHAFRHWTQPPLYLLLVGDANEDYRDLSTGGSNRVPTQEFFGPVRGDGGNLQLISTDDWYIAGLGAGDPEFDLQFDMYVGRLPAQTREECTIMVDKILAYEDFGPRDRWRTRTLTISDDAFSSTISFRARYQRRASEVIFERLSDSLNAMVNREYGDMFDTRAFKVSTYTDQLPEEGRDAGTAGNHFDTTGAPIMYQLISDGNLLMNYQGHANRFLLAHEWIFYSEGSQDHEKFDNTGKPTIWCLFACHPNELDEYDERDAVTGGGRRERSIGELLMVRPEAGVIASFASTGFEWLPGGVNSGPPFQYDLNTPVWQAFFQTPPPEDPAGRPTGARWILGEVMHRSKQIYNLQDSFKGPMFSYILFGDPALRVDAVAPRFEVAAADTVRQDGDRLEVFTTDSDTVVVRAEIRDEVRIGTAEVLEEKVGGGLVAVDPALVTIDSLGTAAMPTRTVRVTYSAPLRPDDYDILLRATDGNGRQVEHRLAVRVDASIKADGQTVGDGDFVAGKAALVADLRSPVPLAADGVFLGVIPAGASDAEPPIGLEVTQRDALGKTWRATGSIDLQGGEHQLVLRLEKNGIAGLDRRWSIVVSGSGELALEQVAAFPNPFSDRTTFNYQLTNWADEVSIRVYTVTGQLVAELEGTSNAGYSQVPWFGRDRDGDPIANGVYIYRIQARGRGREITHVGKVIRSRR